jgi:dTDP-4-amino-4,6-dideoxygalactose transaminase
MQAAVGRVQLTRLSSIVADRRRIAAEYARRLAGIDGLIAPVEPAWARSNWQSYCVELSSGCDQRAVMQKLLDDGISTRRAVMNSHLELPYQASVPPGALPRSEAAQNRGIILPLVPAMPLAQVERICESLSAAVGEALRVS